MLEWRQLWDRRAATQETGLSEGGSAASLARIDSANESATEVAASRGATMMYLVSYQLNPKRDASNLITVLKAFPAWAHYVDDAWLIVTNETAQQVYERLVPQFVQTDRLLVMQVTPTAIHQGWLNKEIWDWIAQHRYS